MNYSWPPQNDLCVCVAQVRGKVSGKDESLLIVGVGWALSLNTGTIAS